jgi:hypothetical protein
MAQQNPVRLAQKCSLTPHLYGYSISYPMGFPLDHHAESVAPKLEQRKVTTGCWGGQEEMGNIFLSSGLFINVSTYLWMYLFIMDYLIYLIYSCIHCIYIYYVYVVQH